MYEQPMVRVRLKRDKTIERTITKVSYELNKKDYILSDATVQEPKKSVEKVADVSNQESQEVPKNKGGRPRKQEIV